ncbi:MAG: hypothetical protein HYZ28_00675 [Myxococcales bacterium]|nr:hypothetical protein [Myxococcales bacterium]
MATRIRLFITEDDERALLRFLSRFRLEVYPRRVPPDWKPFFASEESQPLIPDEAYFAHGESGPVLVDKVKRGPDMGHWRVDEVRSPVIFYERSLKNEEGELLSGQLWAELNWTPQKGRRDAAPELFRRLFGELEGWVKRTFRKSEPKGFLVGPAAARLHKEGLVLRDSAFRGGTVGVHG